MAALFCTPEGVTRQAALCLWGGSQGPAALPGRALCPLRPDGASSPARPALSGPLNFPGPERAKLPTFQAAGLALEEARHGAPPSHPRRYRGRGCAPAGPLRPLRASGGPVSRGRSLGRDPYFSSLAAPAASRKASEGCARLQPGRGAMQRGRTALQWPVCRTARRAGARVPVMTQGPGHSAGRPALEKGCPLLLLKTWPCSSPVPFIGGPLLRWPLIQQQGICFRQWFLNSCVPPESECPVASNPDSYTQSQGICISLLTSSQEQLLGRHL